MTARLDEDAAGDSDAGMGDHEPVAGAPRVPAAFDTPWQAEAFALTVALNEAGWLDWQDWARALGAELAADANRDDGTRALPCDDDPVAQAAYYRAWLRALERLCRERGWAGPLQLAARRETLRAHLRIAESAPLFAGPPAGS
ncbi:MAG: nitrile hydratase accessory protein [Burkholderiaceae bacterium]